MTARAKELLHARMLRPLPTVDPRAIALAFLEEQEAHSELERVLRDP